MPKSVRSYTRCRLLAALVMLFSFSSFISVEAVISWPESDASGRIQDVHAEIGKPLRLNCTVAIDPNKQPVKMVTIQVQHKRKLSDQTTNWPVFGVSRQISQPQVDASSMNNNNSSRVVNRLGEWLTPDEVVYTGERRSPSAIRKMSDRFEYTNSSYLTATFELEAPGVADSGSYFAMEVTLNPLKQQQCFFYVTMYGCPTEMRLTILNETALPPTTTLPALLASNNQTLEAACGYTAFQPGDLPTLQQQQQNPNMMLMNSANDNLITIKGYENDIESERRSERQENSQGPADLLVEVPTKFAQWKRHEQVYAFDLRHHVGLQPADAVSSSLWTNDANNAIDIVCRATVYKDLSRLQRVAGASSQRSAAAPTTMSLAKPEIMCSREVVQSIPVVGNGRASALSSGLSLNTAQIGGIIAAGVGVLIILSGIIFLILRNKKKGRLPTGGGQRRQQHISPHTFGSGAAAKSSAVNNNKNASPDPQSSIAVTPPAAGGGGTGFVVYAGSGAQQRSSSSSKASSRSSPIDNMHAACDTDSASLQHETQQQPSVPGVADRHVGTLVSGGGEQRAGVAANIRLFEQTKHSSNGGGRNHSGGSYNVPAAAAAATTSHDVVPIIAPIKNEFATPPHGKQIQVSRFGGGAMNTNNNMMSSVVSTNVVGEV